VVAAVSTALPVVAACRWPRRLCAWQHSAPAEVGDRSYNTPARLFVLLLPWRQKYRDRHVCLYGIRPGFSIEPDGFWSLLQNDGHIGASMRSLRFRRPEAFSRIDKRLVVLCFWHMSQTITVRITKELATWLEETASRIGVSQGALIREHLSRARRGDAKAKKFMRLAGALRGPTDLSQRKGFSAK